MFILLSIRSPLNYIQCLSSYKANAGWWSIRSSKMNMSQSTPNFPNNKGGEMPLNFRTNLDSTIFLSTIVVSPCGMQRIARYISGVCTYMNDMHACVTLHFLYTSFSTISSTTNYDENIVVTWSCGTHHYYKGDFLVTKNKKLEVRHRNWIWFHDEYVNCNIKSIIQIETS